MGLLALLSSQNKVPTVSMCTDPNRSNYSREGCSSATIELLVAISQRADVKTPPADVTFKLQGRLLCSSSGLD